MRLRYIPAVVLSLYLSAMSAAQSLGYHSGEVEISDGVRVPSPDGKWALVGKGDDIVLFDEHTGKSRTVLTISQSADQVKWSPDSVWFFVDNREASNVESTYLYEAGTLNHFDLGAQIADDIAVHHPEWARFLVPGVNHIYFHAERWADSKRVLVTLSGHFDGFCIRYGKDDCCKKLYPARAFTMHYAVGVNGDTQLLSGGPEKCKECNGH